MLSAPEIRDLPLSLPSCRDEVDRLLERCGLRREGMDYYAGVYIDDMLLAGGGLSGNVIKCVAADERARGMNLTNMLVTHLRARARANGAGNIFVFTKPENQDIFESLSFTQIGAAEKAILLESDSRGVSRWAAEAAQGLPRGEKGAIVMNCNPFTLGHQYLVRTAAARCESLAVFVVQEERSRFPFEVRLELARRGCEEIGGVTVLPGGPYIISGATFPSYFLKQAGDASRTHAELDIDVFARHIAPALDITSRFVGHEPLDPMTACYNEAMRKRLPQDGITVSEIKRIESAGAPISASAVRALAGDGRLDEIKRMVPPATYEYIVLHQHELRN